MGSAPPHSAAVLLGERVFDLGALPVERECLRLGRGDFGLHTREVELGNVAGLVAAFGQAQGVAVGLDGLPHQCTFAVERAQREVGARDVRLHEQPRALEQCFARLGVERSGLARLREAAEQVGLPRDARTGGQQRARVGDARRCRGAAACAGRDADLRQPVGVGGAQQRTCLVQARGRELHAGAVAVGANDQTVERRIGEHLPPFAARLRLGGLGLGPAAVEFLERGRRGGCGCGLDRLHAGAAGEHERGNERQQPCQHRSCLLHLILLIHRGRAAQPATA